MPEPPDRRAESPPMSRPEPPPLTAEQSASAARYLAKVPRAARERGLALFNGGGVRHLAWTYRGELLESAVEDSRRYRQEFHFHGAALTDVWCTCSYGLGCIHCAAALYALLSPQLAAAREAVRPHPAAAAPPRPDLLESLLARAPEARRPRLCEEVCRQVERWFEAGTETARLADLARWSERTTYSEERVRLFPESRPPADAWDLLHCVAAALRRLRRPLPESWDPFLENERVAAIVADWNRSQFAADWRARLRQWCEQPLATAVPELRLRLSPGGGTLEWRPPGATAFEELRASQINPRAGDEFQPLRPLLDPASRVLLDAFSDRWNTISVHCNLDDLALADALRGLVPYPPLRHALARSDGAAFTFVETPLRPLLRDPAAPGGDYELDLAGPDGLRPHAALAIVPGRPGWYLTTDACFPVTCWPAGEMGRRLPLALPAAAIESREGCELLQTLGLPLPPALAARVRRLRPRLTVHCRLAEGGHGCEVVHVHASAAFDSVLPGEIWTTRGWEEAPPAPAAEVPTADPTPAPPTLPPTNCCSSTAHPSKPPRAGPAACPCAANPTPATRSGKFP
jgi:hypothetical protein